MPSVQIKDVPDEVHAVLRSRAAAAHQSLQEYLRSLLISVTSQLTVNEALDRAASRPGGSFTAEEVVEEIRAARAERDRR